MLVSFFILSNTIFIGMEVQDRAMKLTITTLPVFEVASYCFVLIFLFEVILRVLFDSRDYFLHSQYLAWNYFDMSVVVISTAEKTMSLAGTGKFGADVMYIRIIRLARMM